MSRLLKSTTALTEDPLRSQTYIRQLTSNSSSRGPVAFLWPLGESTLTYTYSKKKKKLKKPNHNFSTGIWGIQFLQQACKHNEPEINSQNLCNKPDHGDTPEANARDAKPCRFPGSLVS